MVRGLTPTLLALAVLAVAAPALAKDHGYRSPGGRKIYDAEDRFGRVLKQDTRHAVVEVVTGIAPEGNLGVLLGWLAPQLDGFEFYGGFGLQANPSRQWSVSTRYWPSFGEFRPFAGVGLVHQELYAIGTNNQSLFFELGHKWRLEHTYHLTLSVGLRYLLGVHVEDGSPLREQDVDPTLLQEKLDEVGGLVPTLALRFSRAF